MISLLSKIHHYLSYRLIEQNLYQSCGWNKKQERFTMQAYKVFTDKEGLKNGVKPV